jgi:hypothetical protein
MLVAVLYLRLLWQGLESQRRERLKEDFDRDGFGGLSGIFLNNLERLQELPEHLL